MLFGAQAVATSTSDLPTDRDPHSYADLQQFRVRHVDLDLNVDFGRTVLNGSATLKVERIDADARELVLDTDGLTIRKVELLRGEKPIELTFKLGERDEVRGTPLTIAMPAACKCAPTEDVRIAYETAPQASGLQWLKPEQTAGKRLPFLYSQSQPHHARSWIPLQDTPELRLTYTAHIHTPISMRAVMSAANHPERPRNGNYAFEMKQAIPSYLIALAVGDLDYRSLGPRTGVYADPLVLAAAAHEFADTESMIKSCEKIFGPYRWERYDILILPPSFMWGGMENPRVSFITPTVIAGDRSLVSLIAHELAHSWSGNLVTNARWRDFWLNEGFTTHLERRIMEVLYGKPREAMEDVLGFQSLQRDLERFDAHDDQGLEHLAAELRGRDPDDGTSTVPYEKGHQFLRFLESRAGRERMDAFLRSYFDHFAFQSITTETFREYLHSQLLGGSTSQVTMQEVDEWLYQPGLPKTAVLPQSGAFAKVDAQREKWLQGPTPAQDLDSKAWGVHEWVYFIDNLPRTLILEQMTELDDTFHFTRSHNAAIAHSWLLLVVRTQYTPAYARLEEHLTSIGRRKLTKDLYEELAKTPEGLARARAIYVRARPLYQIVLRGQIDTLLSGRSSS